MSRQSEPLKALKSFVAQYETNREAAAALGISTPYLSQILNGKTTFSNRVLDKLGLRRAVVQK